MSPSDAPRLPPSIGADDLCHPTLTRAPFTREGWIFELKHDGFRALARRGPHGVKFLSRRGRPMGVAFPEVVSAIGASPEHVTLDAEHVVPTADGRSDFEELRRRALLQRPRAIADAAKRIPAVPIVFDVLQAGERDMRALPLPERRAVA